MQFSPGLMGVLCSEAHAKMTNSWIILTVHLNKGWIMHSQLLVRLDHFVMRTLCRTAQLCSNKVVRRPVVQGSAVKQQYL